MAIWGDVQINGTRILRWYARRIGPIEVQAATICTYSCSAHSGVNFTSFELQHAYGKGATSLIAAIMEHPKVVDILPPPPL